MYFIKSVIAQRLQLRNQRKCQYEIVRNTNELSSVAKTSHIDMVKCQAYGEVGVENRSGDSNEVNNTAGVYEHI